MLISLYMLARRLTVDAPKCLDCPSHMAVYYGLKEK